MTDAAIISGSLVDVRNVGTHKSINPCDETDVGMLWYEGPSRRFSERYKFC